MPGQEGMGSVSGVLGSSFQFTLFTDISTILDPRLISSATLRRLSSVTQAHPGTAQHPHAMRALGLGDGCHCKGHRNQDLGQQGQTVNKMQGVWRWAYMFIHVFSIIPKHGWW